VIKENTSMAARRRRIALALATTALAVGAVAAGCGDDDDSGGEGGADLSGTIVIDGSSTVGPLTSAAAERFADDNPNVNIEVRISGTGGGFEAFCAGEIQIANASRAIDEDEVKACADEGVEYEEVRVASDGIVNVVSTSTAEKLGKDDITIDQLKAVWAPDSKVSNWSAIPGGGFNDVPLKLAGPGAQSGTYDFFNEEVLGENAAGDTIEPRKDYSASEDDNNTVRAVTGSEGTMGYFGFSYYEENIDSLKALKVNGVEPTVESITAGDYPLSRPLFIYVSKDALQRPEVLAYVRYYVENAVPIAEEQRFVPAPQESIDEDLQTLEQYSGAGAATTETTE
jgi:phosphate transport system substrate-binding protein